MDVSGKPMGIYSIYLLGRSAGKFQRSLKVKCEKEKMVLTKRYAEQINSDWENKGRYCEYHEQETIEYYTQGEADYQAKIEAEKVETEATKVLKEAIKEVKKPRGRKKAAPKGGANDVTI
jgi:hypothetical protein